MMTRNMRERVLRNFLAAVLQSNLTEDEIRSIGEEFAAGGPLVNQVAQALVRYADASITTSIRSAPKVGFSKQEGFPLAADLVTHSGLTKNELFRVLQTLSPASMKKNSKLAGSPVRTLLKHFFANAAPQEIDKLMELLMEQGGQDPYLKGIVKGT
jgi:hypothetical protein